MSRDVILPLVHWSMIPKEHSVAQMRNAKPPHPERPDVDDATEHVR